ncbi:division/cell wall cluster transcriptional repressor MraZ [Microgenomates group bacterium RIFCSPLOWO2_01_FULL_47_10]|nr:MAG: division/cell wall cluster transcriptional repressor MraZ [Microgenomates group bacterium RIFCSPLOWO2_01_FULL_47_10]
MNFIGRYYHALEQKGRIAIPAAFRKTLGTTAYLTRGLEGCLFLFPADVWEKNVSRIAGQPFTRKSVRDWSRLLLQNAQAVEFDPQGRILIHDHLLASAKLTNECVIAGSGDYLEIWDRSTYHTYLDQLESQAEEIAEKVEENRNV